MKAASAAGLQDAAGPARVRTIQSKLLGLQVLRFAAAFFVVLFHLGVGLQIEFGNRTNIFHNGAIGVDIFFVISGFIIAYTTDPQKGVLYFVRRRLMRIVPLYWTLTAGIAVLATLKPGLLNSTAIDGETLIKSLFFVPFAKANGAVQPILFLGWTLNYEMFFYGIYAACLAFGLCSPLVPAAIIVLLVAATSLVKLDYVPWRFYTSPLMLEFVLGIGLYLLYRRSPAIFRGRSLPIFLVFVAAMALRAPLLEIHWLVANGIPAVLLVAAVLPWAPAPTPIVLFMVLLGNVSYSLYLSHPYVLQLAVKLMPDHAGAATQILLGGAACVLSVALSIVLYFTIERPAQLAAPVPKRR
ncbi:acyltransferase [Mesorhizobium sp. WSM4904]|uniref:acyltransferase family protein n=1 Tax=Mesorhizobium sp. WSM4904 TaxID=3038545 RepID=UPI002418B98D|nr:acyltransferase [Mesorhizobium sp. WSM4904]WFP64660.1 acyltransferase [Mesorhizobium sp. WSM4904]